MGVVHCCIQRMMVPLYLFLSLASLSRARSIAPSVADSNQVPVADARFDDGAVNFGSGMPLPGFRNIGPQYGSFGGPTGYGGQQPAYGGQQPAYGGQQPAYGGQPGYGQQAPTYESSPEYAAQPGYSSPGYGGKGYGHPGFLNSGYRPGFMSAPVFGGFGPFGGPHASSGGYFVGPYGSFGGRFGGKHGGRFGGFGTKYGGGFRGYGGRRNGIFGAVGRFDPYGDFEDMFEDQNADDYPFGPDLEEDGHLTSTSARLEKYLQKQWQLGKRKLQVQVDFGNVPLEWEYLNQYHGVRHPLAMTAFGPKYGLAGPPALMFDYGYGPVQQGGVPMPSPFFGQQAPGSWQQQQFGPAPVQQPEAPVQQGEETVQQPATSR